MLNRKKLKTNHKEELEEELVTLQEQETLIIEETQETNTIIESKEHEVETQIIEETQNDSDIVILQCCFCYFAIFKQKIQKKPYRFLFIYSCTHF